MSRTPRARSPTASLTATKRSSLGGPLVGVAARWRCRCGPGCRRASPGGRWRAATARKCASTPSWVGLVVVRRDDQQQPVARRAWRPAGRARRECAVSLVPTPATTVARSPTASTTARRMLAVLLDGGGRRLAGRAGDDEAVVAVVDEVRRDRGGGVEVDRAVVVERRHHRGEHPAEGAAGVTVAGRAVSRGVRLSAGLGVDRAGQPGASGHFARRRRRRHAQVLRPIAKGMPITRS